VKIELLKFPVLAVPAAFDAAVRMTGIVFTVAAIILAGRWLTELTAPGPVARLPSATITQPENKLNMISRLFRAEEARPASLDGLLLTGVFAGAKGGGFATFQAPHGAVAAFPGDEVVPGVKLKQIERDRVILLTTQAQRELRLRTEDKTAAASPISDNPAQINSDIPARLRDAWPRGRFYRPPPRENK
jgi:hypothetical protein